MRDSQHIVWNVHDRFRTTRLNCKYFRARLAAVEKSNTKMEFIIAATASGSAVTALTYWQTEKGQLAWTILTTLSAVLSVLKPTLKLPERMTKLEELATSYNVLENEYQKLEVSIEQRNCFDEGLQRQFDSLLDRENELRTKELVERTIDKKLRAQLMVEVESELPKERFFIPGGTNG